MILWVVLFGLVVLASFILALQSMRDYQEIPSENEYSLFLIRKPLELTSQFLDSLQKSLKGQVLSLERLVKGNQSALVIYGPRTLLLGSKDLLDLLELEDYVKVNRGSFTKQISSWEVGVKEKDFGDHQRIFQSLPQLSDSEQFWWQLLLSPNSNLSYLCQIRVIIASKDTERRRSLTETLQKLVPEKLIKLPKAYSNAQLLDFYAKRIFRNDPANIALNSEEALKLIKL